MWTLLRPGTCVTRPAQPQSREQIFRALLGIRQLMEHSVWWNADPRQGAGLGVLLVPGFGFGDRSLALTSRWLTCRGYRPVGARIGLNVGCSTELIDRIERGLVAHAEATGGKVVLLGQSRGGWLARLVAARRPDLVRGLVMLGCPVLDPLGVKPNLIRTARLLARLSGWGVPGLLNDDCMTGSCCQSITTALAADLPAGVPALSVYSRSDGVVPWQLCLDPSAECVEIASGHVAMTLEPDFYTVLAPKLAEWAMAGRGAAV
jgi:pimeloyl-ACP methyl ester carboxylesterase